MHKAEMAELTVLCLIEDGNRLLLQNRVKNDWKGYTFPGGHVEQGESFVDAVKREMKEETGLDATAGELVDVVESSFVQKGERHCEINLVYRMSLAERDLGRTESREDWICFEWVPCERLGDVNLLPPEMKTCIR